MLWRRVWRDNQNPHIEEEQTTQWPKENVQKDKQRSTKHTSCRNTPASNLQFLKFYCKLKKKNMITLSLVWTCFYLYVQNRLVKTSRLILFYFFFFLHHNIDWFLLFLYNRYLSNPLKNVMCICCCHRYICFCFNDR